MLVSRVSVAIVFSVLGVSFIASTALLIYEFRELNWLTLVVTHGHLFLFFPLFGVLALFALYVPAVVFTDLLWTKIYSGQNRFLLGCILMAALSTGVAKFLDGPPRSIWEIAPAALAADKGDPAEGRMPILDVLEDLRQRAQITVGLSRFARACAIDPLLEPPPEMLKRRYCFPAKSLLNGVECCRVQNRFREAVSRLQQDASARSESARVDASVFLPLKNFFVLIVLVIGVLLATARENLDVHYAPLVPVIERGVVLGAMSMLCWTAMDYGYQQTANALFGRMTSGPQLRLSLVIAPWALLVTFYFLRRLGKQGETVGQIAGVVTAAVAVLSYESFNDWIARLVGPGMDAITLVALMVVAAAGIVTVRVRDGLGTAYMSEGAR